MSDRPKHIDVISYNGIDYHKGDLVEIQTIGTYGHRFIGCIDSIDISNFWLDISEQYKSNVMEFDYDNIQSIRLLERENEPQCE